MKDAVLWLGRIATLLPELIGLWKAIESKDEPQTLDAILRLRRKVSDAQAIEEIRGG